MRKLVRRDGPLSMEAAARIVSQVAEALQHAHERGMIHRDVKPGNVLVTPDGEAKLLDLGLAGPLSGDLEADPRHGKIVGTVDYVSPDHIAAPQQSHARLGHLFPRLHALLRGDRQGAVSRRDDGGQGAAHCELRPLDPRRLNPRLSAEFVDVLADMMAKDPAQRLQSATQVIEAMKPWTRLPPPPASWWRPVVSPPPSAVSPLAAPAGFPPAVIVPPPVIAPISGSASAVPVRAIRNGGRPATEDSNSQDSLRVEEVGSRRRWLLFVVPALAAIATWFLARWLFGPQRP